MKLSRLSDLKGKNRPLDLGVSAAIASQTRVMLRQRIGNIVTYGFVSLAWEVLFSADIGQSLKILLYYIFLSVDIKKSQSILTAWKPLAIHPRVRANRALIRLGCNFKNMTTEIILFL